MTKKLPKTKCAIKDSCEGGGYGSSLLSRLLFDFFVLFLANWKRLDSAERS